MNAPVDKMLEDGEPNKPFFFCWANEAWTKRWDGSRNEILIDQDYTDVQGNINHFEYLLKFFRHKNYILVDGRPMFSFYRIEQTDVSRLDAIMALWDKLAVENGLQGIHFVRWLGPFDNRIKSAHIAGGIEFEPGYSSAWRSVVSSPSIFKDGKFDSEIYSQNNPDVAEIATSKGVSVKSLFAKSSPTEQLFRSSQYKVYDRNIVWRNIENKVLPKNVICGTFATWNNAPRRNFTNDNYNSYPHMYMPDTLRGLQKHLEFMRAKVLYRRTRERYLLLTAWNEWNEQAQFEPSDVDGYDALSAVKMTFKAHTDQTIIHVKTNSTPLINKSVNRYIRDLSILFNHYDHETRTLPIKVGETLPALLHIHCVADIDPNDIDNTARVYITVHDVQCLHSEEEKSKGSSDTVQRLLSIADKVIFHSMYLRDYFAKRMKLSDNVIVAPPSDVMPAGNFVKVPALKRTGGKTVLHIVFVDNALDENKPTKGFLSFYEAALSSKSVVFYFHLYGNTQGTRAAPIPNARYRSLEFGTEKNKKMSLIVFLENHADPCGYEVTRMINTGLPLLYHRQGALTERLDSDAYRRYIPFHDYSEVPAMLRRAVSFIEEHAGRVASSEAFRRSRAVQPSKWYIMNYPVTAI